jgi:alpha-amylase/alpha-mannosidase (GH57 family)
LVVHGHFYQPPRENPWTDEVGREPSATPFANWNTRINAECYRANAYARVFGEAQKLTALVNNYERMSLDLGPTLARWIARHDPQVLRRMRQGDEEQRTRLGGGGAMAHVWGHPIAPLLTPRDLKTQIQWGLFDFQARFGREAQGMWLPETAANPRTLAALIDAGLQYTILAPEQIAAVRAPSQPWLEVNKDTLDTGRLYRFMHPDGSDRSLACAIFDGPLSRDLAFGQATRDANNFLSAIEASAARSHVDGRRLVLAASDGELYGHHKKFADLALAYATRTTALSRDIEVTNLETLLAESSPTWEIRLRPGPKEEGTAWSCSHGLGRWLRDCGCRMNDIPGNRQTWRGPLRKALDFLRDEAAVFFSEAQTLFLDPWDARDHYGAFIDEPAAIRKRRLQAFGTPQLKRGRSGAKEAALVHMEMQRSLQLMYASCAWFFDDIAGTEAALSLRRAGHAMDLWRTLGGTPPEDAVLDLLAQAKSNTSKLGTGADAYRRAMHARVAPKHVVACSVFERLASHPTIAATNTIPGHLVKFRRGEKKPTLRGMVTVVNHRFGSQTTLPFAATYDGFTNFKCTVGKEELGLSDLRNEFGRALRFGALVRVALKAVTMEVCEALLTLTQELEPFSPDEEQAVNHLYARLVGHLLEQNELHLSVNWQTVLRLAERANLPSPTDEGQRVQEAVWEALDLHQRRRQRVPKALTELANLLGFVLPLEGPTTTT